MRVFRSSAADLQQFVAEPVPFPILADPQRNAYRRFGVGGGWLGLLCGDWRRGREAMAAGHKVHWGRALREGFLGNPADFLIGPDGRIEQAHYGTQVADSWTPDQVLALLRG